MKIREDVRTVPIDINVQSAGVSQEKQIFYTNDEYETEEQNWARKEAIRKNPAVEEPYKLSIQTWSDSNPKYRYYGRRTRTFLGNSRTQCYSI